MKRRDVFPLLGAAAAWPFAARAQQKAMPVVGYFGGTTLGSHASQLAGVRQGLVETGYVEGRNVAIEYRFAQGRSDRLPALAAELVARNVDVILAPGLLPLIAARDATQTIPIVTVGGTDLVAAGFVSSFARPGGNITGIAWFTREMNLKRFELMTELVPQPAVIAVLVNPSNPLTAEFMRDVDEAARTKGRQLAILKASTEGEIDAAFATLIQLRAGALVVAADGYFNGWREQIVALAAR